MWLVVLAVIAWGVAIVIFVRRLRTWKAARIEREIFARWSLLSPSAKAAALNRCNQGRGGRHASHRDRDIDLQFWSTLEKLCEDASREGDYDIDSLKTTMLDLFSSSEAGTSVR
jgi:hypothetical protein